MLYFIVPLRAPERSRDWNTVSRLACETLASICFQTCQDFEVILVCNKIPQGFSPHEKVRVIEENFPLPDPQGKAPLLDKYKKIRRGLAAIRTDAPCHVMLVDADDLVSRRLADWVRRNPNANGWVGNHGYLASAVGSWLLRSSTFHLRCGSSHIVRCEPSDLPDSMDGPVEQFPLLATGHHLLVEEMARRGRPLAPLPFPIGIYRTGHGENTDNFHFGGWKGWRFFIRNVFHYRWISRSLREEFGIPEKI